MRTTFIFSGLAIIMMGCQPETSRTPAGPPNIIVIFADDLGYGDLSIYGHPTIHTPHLDQMALEGMKFTSAYSAAPVCTPSRAALLTGRLPINVGMPGNQGPDSEGGLPHDERTLAEALKELGYRTAAYGKWHLGSTEGYFPTDHGFDEYFGLLYSNDMIPPWVNTERPMHLYENKTPTPEQPVDQTTITKRFTEAAVNFIIASGDQPFFIYLPHSMPHLPVYASEAFQGTSMGGRYGDVIEEIDWSVGTILQTLKDQGIDDNTLVVFTSDNGPWRNMPPRMYTTEPVEKWHGGTTGPLRGAKATTFEGGFRVPAIWHFPGRIPAHQVSAEVVSTMDIHATVLNLVNASESEKPLDGKDIWPVLTEGASSPHTVYPFFRGRRLEGVRKGEWKLRISKTDDNWRSPELDSGDEPIEMFLFNMKDDPFEQFDRKADFPEIVENLLAEMRTIAENTGGTIEEISP